ncbi:MAG TPA: T9SS type A sorting domain-containing protein [Cryomorphaceae bacterium]|nr:T9SS type A sorting domain-containing protein [Cryomorphaceae bacterium]
MNTASGQNNFWTFPEEYWEPGQSFPQTLPTTNFSYSGGPSDFVHAGLRDPYGEEVFFVMDGVLYDETAASPDNFIDSSVNFIEGHSEVLIIPKPDTCDQFYIFQGSSETLGTDEFPFVSEYHRDIGMVSTPGVGQNAFNLVNDMNAIAPIDWNDDIDHGVQGVHFASTRQRNDGSRWVYIAHNHYVFRVEVTCDGFQNTGWKRELSNGYVELGWRSELELYEDTADNSVRIAAPYAEVNGPQDRIYVSVFDVDDNLGAYVPGSEVTIALQTLPSGAHPYIHGLEFSPDGKGLYLTHEPAVGYPGPLSFYDFTSGTLTSLNFPDIQKFRYSQLQISGDSANYSLNMASDSAIGTLLHPNTPDVNFWNSNAVSLNNYPISRHGFSFPVATHDQHIVPDQVDYDDYIEDFFYQDCECCNKYAYGGQTKDTLHQAFGTENWAYGVGSNPWNAEEGDTIFIRDELVIKAGANVTISDMWFKFGPDARVIVERGTQTENGGRLTLQDSTVFTADFRCSKREYGCEEPDSCKTKLWKGVRVEGYTNEGQTYGFQTNQAFFAMKTEAMIEYAEIAIRVGHESENNYGGGVIFLTDARLKDNPIGVRFDPYQRMPSPPDEEMTLSKIRTSNLFWSTDSEIENFIPNRHVDVRESSGIKLEANRYVNENWEAYDGPDRGTGIYSINSRVVDSWLCTSAAYPCPETDVERSSFLNMHKGFDAYASGSSRTIESLHAIYDNNTIGILSNGLVNPLILDNDFYVPTKDNHTGIYLLGSTGYAVENNYFTSGLGPGPNWNFGIAVVSSGQAINEIYRNLFEDITVGIITQEQNGYCKNLDFGLKWKCNQFEQPIHYADIYVQSGNVSDDQGLCTSGTPAGNKFSHSHDVINGHYDLKVKNANQPYDDPACPTIVPLEIVYKHHTPLNTSFLERLAPEEYTNSIINPLDNDHVGLIPCGVAYDFRNSCTVKNTSVHEPEDFPTKSDDEEVTMESLEIEAAEIYDALYANAEILDNGNTDLLISMIYNGAPAEEIEALLEEAGEMVSSKVVQDLLNSNDESLQTLGENVVWELSEIDVDLENIEPITLPSQEVEAEWMQLNEEAHQFWNQVVRHFQRDSLNAFPGTAIRALVNTYQPASQQRFVAALSAELGMEVPAWIEVENNPLAAPTASMPTAGENGTLPRNVGSYIDEGVFNEYRNVAAFNQTYIEQGAEYDPGYIDLISEGYELPGSDKSNGFDPDAFQNEEQKFLLLPNPFNERITLQAEEDLEYEKLRVTIRDVVGRVVYDANYGANQQVVIDGNRFSTGVFIYTIFTDGKMAQSGKIVKAK